MKKKIEGAYIYYTRPNVDHTNNIIIGIAVGVMVVACSLILLVMFVNK